MRSEQRFVTDICSLHRKQGSMLFPKNLILNVLSNLSNSAAPASALPPSTPPRPSTPRRLLEMYLKLMLRRHIYRSSRLLDSPSVDYRAGVRGRSRNPSGASSVQGARQGSEAREAGGSRLREANPNRPGSDQNMRRSR